MKTEQIIDLRENTDSVQVKIKTLFNPNRKLPEIRFLIWFKLNHPHGYGFPSNQDIADGLGINPMGASRIVRKLKAAGYLETKETRNGTGTLREITLVDKD